ncbi:hypothetical protein B0G80_3689 [Paraburkholderia sp. BL6669N2]|uniref:hypothetical protein n=1 Tax=Paraburkholderia sp. BL6669N2 TaxID=1938807 RepID=UPI000E2629FE|nr:hypothetical protein [Paraburkholderia sp. BL6669N2]REG60865.1 hypothetical protein B0G80_3689 [Paraburkholderia sp. BL6669N2]
MNDGLKSIAAEPWSDRFLSEIRDAASWLQSPFNSPVLKADFGKGQTLLVDFRIDVGGQGQLVDSRHRVLFEDIQYFILLQTHPCVRGRGYLSPETQRLHVIRGLHVVDHFLLNATSTKLAQYGFRGVVSHELKSMLAERACSPDVEESVYRWSTFLAKTLREKSATLTQADIEDVSASHPEILDIPIHENDWSLDLELEELKRARIWLFLNKGYVRPHKVDYRLSPSSSFLSKLIYRNTLWGSNPQISRTAFEELCVSPKENTYREYDEVPVKPGSLDEACSRKHFEKYRSTLVSFQHLSRLDRGIPESSLAELSTFDIEAAQRLKADCTIGIAPFDYVRNVVKQAVDFYFAHNATLFTCCANVLGAARRAGVSAKKFFSSRSIQPYLTRNGRRLGIRFWSLAYQMSFIESNPNRKETHLPKQDYFDRLRRNEGLLEMMRVLYGAMQLIVGWLMALRVGEMIDLNALSLSDNNRWLAVQSRKSGPGKFRRTDLIPAPALVARIMRRLIEFRRMLSVAGVAIHESLFAVPTLDGDRLTMAYAAYNARIDCFIDYIEAPVTESGLRYYIRQHQLRKNFALWFYAEAPFETTDTLQWFLRQRDAEQTEHYLRANFSGQVLRTLQSTAATLMVRDGRKEADDLAAIALRRFGADRHSVIDERRFAEYTRYVEKLRQEGSLIFDVHYMCDSNQKSHVVSLVVFDHEEEDADNESVSA